MPLTVTPTALPEVLLLEPRLFTDARGSFFESFNQREFEAATGVHQTFVQDNHSCSGHGVLRGMHFQIGQAQGKLIRATSGEVFDVAVDVRRSSPTFKRWVGVTLSAENRRQLWIPEGFAHGFLVISEFAEVLYKTTDYWQPTNERSLLWNDPDVGIDWPTSEAPVLAAKDASAPRLHQAELY